MYMVGKMKLKKNTKQSINNCKKENMILKVLTVYNRLLKADEKKVLYQNIYYRIKYQQKISKNIAYIESRSDVRMWESSHGFKEELKK